MSRLRISKRFFLSICYPDAGQLYGENVQGRLFLEGPVDPKTGMITELASFDRLMWANVLSQVDHHNLADLDGYSVQDCPLRQLSAYLLDSANLVLDDPHLQVSGCDLFAYPRYGIDVSKESQRYYVGLGGLPGLDVDVVCQGDVGLFRTRQQQHGMISALAQCFRDSDETYPVADIRALIATNQGLHEVSLNYRLSGLRLSVKQDDLDAYFSTSFSATHCLVNATLSPAENKKYFGKCQRRHGHRFVLRTCLSADAFDLASLPDEQAALIRYGQGLDAKDLNVFPGLNDSPATVECLIPCIADDLRRIHALPLKAVRLDETANNRFDFLLEGGS